MGGMLVVLETVIMWESIDEDKGGDVRLELGL